MFWNLLLAHFVGDYLLQTDWMAKNREKLWVLSLHVSIHFGAMLLLVGVSRSFYWPTILILALIHFAQDALKLKLIQKLPDWSVFFYLLDQVLHISFIWIFDQIFQLNAGVLTATQTPAWIKIGIAYLFVTFIWFITEKIIYAGNPDTLLLIRETKLGRMLVRTGLISIFLVLRTWQFPGLAMVAFNPYPTSDYRPKALMTDMSVSILAIVFLLWVL